MHFFGNRVHSIYLIFEGIYDNKKLDTINYRVLHCVQAFSDPRLHFLSVTCASGHMSMPSPYPNHCYSHDSLIPGFLSCSTTLASQSQDNIFSFLIAYFTVSVATWKMDLLEYMKFT